MKTGKTVGVYDRPTPKRWPKVLAIALAVLIAVVIAVLVMGEARGDSLRPAPPTGSADGFPARAQEAVP